VRRFSLPNLLAGYLVIGLLCWGLAGGAISVASAARLGGGLAVAWSAGVSRRAFWPVAAPARAFEHALRHVPGPPAAPPASYRMTYYAVTMSCSPAGDAAVQTRLKPLLREIAVHRLASHRGIDFYSEPSAALALLGDDLFALVSGEHAMPSRRSGKEAPGIPLQVLEDWVERLAAI
jgi:hypothetical protein